MPNAPGNSSTEAQVKALRSPDELVTRKGEPVDPESPLYKGLLHVPRDQGPALHDIPGT